MNIPNRAIVIREPYCSRILNGNKLWEIRGSRTNIRERIALIAGGTGTVIGTAELVDCIGVLSLTDLELAFQENKIGSDELSLSYKNTYAWVMNDPVLFSTPIKYEHPQGAVIWVTLDSTVKQEIEFYTKNI